MVVRRLALLLALLPALAGCGASETAAPAGTETEPPPETTTAAEETTRLVVYFLRDGKVAPVHREVPQTAAVGTAAVEALLAGPTAEEGELGITSDFPDGTRLLGLMVEDGTASVSLSGGDTSTGAPAQLTFTLTQFSTVQRVAVGEATATRADFADLTPIILVERPALGEAVSSPVQVRGTASVFEATLHVRLVGPGGEEIRDEVLTASEGAPGRGTFSVEIPFSASGPGTVEAYTLSAADGSEQHNVQVRVTLAP